MNIRRVKSDINDIFLYLKFHVMLPPHAVVMEAAQMMEIANVTVVSIHLIVQVIFI